MLQAALQLPLTWYQVRYSCSADYFITNSLCGTLGVQLQFLGECTAVPIWLSWLAGWPAALIYLHKHWPVHQLTASQGIGQWPYKVYYCTTVVAKRSIAGTLYSLPFCFMSLSFLYPFLLPLWPRKVATGVVSIVVIVPLAWAYTISVCCCSQDVHPLFPDVRDAGTPWIL